MKILRHCWIALLLACATSTWAQRDPMILYNFIDIPVAVPAGKERVKTCIVRGALFMSWDIVEQPDGSLLASWSRPGDYGMKVKITYDAARYSLVYVDSQGLKARPQDKLQFVSEAELERALAMQVERFKDWAETPYMVKTNLYIHLNYEDDVRGLLASIRRQLLAPAL